MKTTNIAALSESTIRPTENNRQKVTVNTGSISKDIPGYDQQVM